MANRDISSLFLQQTTIEGFRSINKVKVNLKRGLNILIGKNGAGKSNLLHVLNESLKISGLSKDVPVKRLSLKFDSINTGDTFKVDYVKKSVDPNELELDPSQKHYFESFYRLNGKELTFKSIVRRNVKTGKKTQVLRPRTYWYHYILREHNLRFPKGLLLGYQIPQSTSYVDMPGRIVVDYEAQDLSYQNTFDFLDILFWKIEMEIQELFPEDFLYEDELEQFAEKLNIDFVRSLLVFDEFLIDSLYKYTPIKKIRFNPNINIYRNEAEFIIDNIRIDFYVNDNWLPWSQLSDGTKRLFYIISQINGLDNDIILLEEPELGIHPHQFHGLMQFIVEKSDYNQIIISTHSPLALNHLEIDELNRIQIVSYSKGLGTQIRGLTAKEERKAGIYMAEIGYLSDYWVHSDLEGND